jgi:hypothetical protein
MDDLTETIAMLVRGGAVLELSQADPWPEGVDEERLRDTLRGFQAELLSLAQRAADLYKSLPEPPELVHGVDDPEGSIDDVPPGVYFHLTGVLDLVVGDCAELAKAIGDALEASPESLRADWIQRNVPGELRRLIPGAEAGGED